MPAGNPIEAGTGDVWYAKQAALGTIAAPADAATKHLRKVGDNALKAAKSYGSEEWVDGQAWGSPGMFVEAVGGPVGTVPFQGQIETAGFAFAQITGVDTVTGTTPDFTHTITTGSVQGPYGTWRQKTGVAVGPWRNAFWDSKISKLTWNCGQEQKVAHIDVDVVALKAGQVFTADPTAVDSGTDAFRWDEATGAHTIDAVVINEIDGETLELDRKLDVHRGDAVAPTCVIPGKGEISTSMSAIVSDQTIPIMYKTLYGTTTPPDATLPDGSVNYVALESTYTRTAVRSLKITRPRVAVDPNDWEVGPRAEGGKIPIAFAGRCLRSGATPQVTVVAKTGDATAYV